MSFKCKLLSVEAIAKHDFRFAYCKILNIIILKYFLITNFNLVLQFDGNILFTKLIIWIYESITLEN